MKQFYQIKTYITPCLAPCDIFVVFVFIMSTSESLIDLRIDD
jgi:hypothetical protein